MAKSTDAALLGLIGDLLGLVELSELREALLVALDRAVPSEWVSINEIGPRPEDMQSVIRPAVPERLHDTWAEHGHENPLIARFARTLDTRAYRFSDVVSSDALHSLPLYQQFYAELGVEHQIAFVVQVSNPFYVGIALSRAKRDFTDAERDLLDQARPFLIGIYRTAIAYATLGAQRRATGGMDFDDERLMERGLTPREAAVLGRVAHGLSNRDVAIEFGLSERTVGKHLQRCYRKLGARDRSHAAAIAWSALEGSHT
jgi:DNA-binding CsgD family transcriptional regulator